MLGRRGFEWHDILESHSREITRNTFRLYFEGDVSRQSDRPRFCWWRRRSWWRFISNHLRRSEASRHFGWQIRRVKFQRQVVHLRKTETNPANYRAADSGFLAEIDRMKLEFGEYFSASPAEQEDAA